MTPRGVTVDWGRETAHRPGAKVMTVGGMEHRLMVLVVLSYEGVLHGQKLFDRLDQVSVASLEDEF